MVLMTQNNGHMDSLFKYVLICVFLIIEMGIIQTRDSKAQVTIGLENLIDNDSNDLKNKDIGIVANHTSVDKNGDSIVKLLSEISNVKAVFSPEHGFEGNLGAGETVGNQINESLKIFSLYGSFRTPTRTMLEDIDLLVYDIQDVGVKFYTYISTLFLAMRAAKRDAIPIYVLDRPNPINANRVEGAVTSPVHTSFVGAAPLITRYGMTVGELARMFNEESYLGFSLQADLHVIEMEGYRRSMWFDETGRPWIKPSPNMPDLETALVYPGMCLIEGTNLSEGRGTDKPFLKVGAPYINSKAWIANIPNEVLEGVKIESIDFTPRSIKGVAINPKYKDQLCYGIEIKVIDRDLFKPIPFALALLCSARNEFPDQFKTRRFLDQLWGNEDLRAMLTNGDDYTLILKTTARGLIQFKKIRDNYLSYE